MSTSPQNANSNLNPNPTTNAGSATNPNLPTLGSGQPANSTPTQDSAAPNSNFTTGNIGRWASQQENVFAEQNRKADAEKQKRNQQFRKIAPYLYIGGGIIVVALIVWGIIALVNRTQDNPSQTGPVEIAGSTSQDIADYQEILQSFYSQHDGTRKDKQEGINQIVQNTINSTSSGQENVDAIRLAQMGVYAVNGLYDAAIEVANNANPDNLTLDQLASYYNIMYDCYSGLGNTEKADEYDRLSYEVFYDIEQQRTDQEDLND